MQLIALDPEVVRQMMREGWTVMYGSEVIAFHSTDRAIRLFDFGHVEVEDGSDGLHAPSLGDPTWTTALTTLGIEPGKLELNPFLRRWTYPVGTLAAPPAQRTAR